MRGMPTTFNYGTPITRCSLVSSLIVVGAARALSRPPHIGSRCVFHERLISPPRTLSLISVTLLTGRPVVLGGGSYQSLPEYPNTPNHANLPKATTQGTEEKAVTLDRNGMSTGMSLTHIYAHIPGNPWEDLSAPDGPTFCDPGARSLYTQRRSALHLSRLDSRTRDMSEHAPDVVSLGKALYTTFLTPPRCEWVPNFGWGKSY
ncbi:hypothetical protein Bbelb_030040 [Branchiostoma belcheri]|nr:hypothetical protein Bbelb_030040 [Branchiostoma belcheri]